MTKLLQVTDNFSTMRSEKTSVKTCLVRILERVCFIEKKRNENTTKRLTTILRTFSTPLRDHWLCAPVNIHELLNSSPLIYHSRDQIENMEMEKLDCIQL